MRTIDTDVLVVGSGFGAAPAALRLATAGLGVTVIEKGSRIDPWGGMFDTRREDVFRQTQDPKYLLKYFKGMAGDNLSVTQIEALGGGSGFYEMISLRAPSIAFDQRDADGSRAWPAGMSRSTLDPYYDVGEAMLGVEQIAPERVPKSGLVFSLLMKNLGYSCDRAPYAVRNCVGSGYCVTGCIYGAKKSLLLNYLPQAEEAGAVVKTETEALEIRPIGDRQSEGPIDQMGPRYEVRCRSTAQGGATVKYRTKILILGGGTIGTAKLLLASPRLTQLSGETGRHIGFNGGVKIAGLIPEGMPNGDMFVGQSHPGMISYHFLQSRGITIASGKPLPLQLIAAARIRKRRDGDPPLYWGSDHVDLMKQYRRRVIAIAAFGLTPPTGRLNHLGNGRFDLQLQLTDELRQYYRETKQLLQSIFERNGGEVLDADFVDSKGSPRDDIHFSTTHQVGSCRMADSPESGTCNSDGEVFGYPGMFVTDGAAIPTSLAVNTSLTILANAERIVERIRTRYTPRT